MRTVLGTTFAFLLVFLALLWIGMDSRPQQSAPAVLELALYGTMRLFGAAIAAVAAVGLLFIAASKGSFDRQLDLVLPFLAGLALASPHWGVTVALGAVAIAWVLREMSLGSRGKEGS